MTPTPELEAAVERLKMFSGWCETPHEDNDEAFGDYTNGRNCGLGSDLRLVLASLPTGTGEGEGWFNIGSAPEEITLWGLRIADGKPQEYDAVDLVWLSDGCWFGEDGEPIQDPVAWRPAHKPNRPDRAILAALASPSSTRSVK